MSAPSPFVVEMRDVVKRFGAAAANDGASLAVREGEIHALVGENGAGKSTLMKVLYGLHAPDAGEVLVGGEPVSFRGPADAMRAGIGMVHQHFMLVPTLTAAENMVLGAEPVRGGFLLDAQRAIADAAALSKRYGLAVDPAAMAGDLSVGEQQRLEILKVLYRGARILILDEPTAVLTPRETAAFFDVLRSLTAQGKTVILITHKLGEVRAVSQHVTVMRKGRTVGTVATADVDEAALARMMVGREVAFAARQGPRPGAPARPVVLSVEGVHAKNDRGLDALRGVSLEVRAGEVLGIAGVEGNGQSELVEVVSGLRRPNAGWISVAGELVTRGQFGVGTMRAAGTCHIPEDRHRRGLILDYTVADNLILGRHREAAFSTPLAFKERAVAAFAAGLTEKFDIQPPDPSLRAEALSGGNQQKVVVARELSRSPRLLVAAQPTRGVDVGAIEFIHARILEARDAGAAVLLVSAELSELLALSDRIAVMYRGKVAGVFSAAEATEEKIGLLMAGGAA